jgi:hypothetical protein
MSFFPVVLATHITLALALFLPSVILPFALRARRGTARRRPGRLTGVLVWLQSNGSLVIGGGVAVTGVLLIAMIGVELLRQPWLLVAMGLYAANLALAFFIQRPGLRRLLGLRADATDEERARWSARARRQRYVSYVMAATIGLIAFLMTTKPRI